MQTDDLLIKVRQSLTDAITATPDQAQRFLTRALAVMLHMTNF